MTIVQDTLEDAGGMLAGELAGADLPVPGESIAIGIGAIAQAVRPFTEPLGGVRTATSLPQGMITGGLAIKRYKAALKRRYTPAPVPPTPEG